MGCPTLKFHTEEPTRNQMRLRRNDFFLDVEAQIDNDKGVHSRIGRVYGCKDGSVREDTLAPLCVGRSSPPAPHTAPRACLGPLPRTPR